MSERRELTAPEAQGRRLGYISAYGLEKLQTRNHYCVSVSNQAEKEYVIPVFAEAPPPESHLVTDADRIDGLRKLAGYVENGSDTTVSYFQDDATKSWMVRVGKSWPSHGSSLREAIDAALATEGPDNG